MTFITHGFRVSVVSDVRERVRDFRITFALYAKKIFISWVCYTETGVYKASIFFSSTVCSTTFYTIKSSLKLAYKIKTIIWNRHGHECSRIWKLFCNFIKKCRDFLGRDILGTTFFRAESSLIQSSCRSFIRVIVPYEISKVNFRVETKILVSMSEEI